MKPIRQPRWLTLLGDERGATAVEYGLIVALLAMALSAIMFTVGDNIKTVFTTIVAGLTGS